MSETPAATLRRAAARLRELVTAVETDIATNPYWTSDEHPPHDYPHLYARGADNGLGGPAGAYAAAMHPGVGVALADWLDAEAAIWDAIETVKTEYGPKGLKVTMPVSTHDQALAVARAVLGA